MVTRTVTINICTKPSTVAVTCHEVTIEPHSMQRNSNQSNENAYRCCGSQRLEQRSGLQVEGMMQVFAAVSALMFIGFHDPTSCHGKHAYKRTLALAACLSEVSS